MTPHTLFSSPFYNDYIKRNPSSMFNRAPQTYKPLHTPTMAERPAGMTAPPSFAAGGMMSAQGQPIRPGAGMQPEMPQGPMLGADQPAALTEAQIAQETDRYVRTSPEAVERVQSVVAYAMQSGQLTPDELNMAVQLAKAALANPASYPQIRKFAIENGLGTEQDLPPQMDKGLLLTLIFIGKAMQPSGQQPAGQSQGAPQGGNVMQGNPPGNGLLPEYKKGGTTGAKKHIAVMHENEYVIPADALLYHGKKTFDKLIEAARAPADGN